MAKPAADQSNEVLESAKAYRAIKTRLLALIGTRWPVGSKLPPIKELAREIGAGQTNTHRAVKDLVKDGRVICRAGQGTFVLDYASGAEGVFSPRLYGMPAGRQVTGAHIEVLLPERELDLFISSGIDAALEVLIAAGCRVSRRVSKVATMADLREPTPGIDGVLMLNGSERTPIQLSETCPVVCLSTTASVRVPSTTGFDVVMADSEQGGHLIGEHMRKLGCKSVCFVGVAPSDGSEMSVTSILRRQGFEAGWGKKLTNDQVFCVPTYTSTEGALFVQKYLAIKNRPEAIFAASDDLAVGFVHGALAHGILPGRDYLIAGFDGQERGRTLPTGVLTTAALPSEAMGRAAAGFLLSRIGQSSTPVRRLTIGCTLVQGDTTKRP